MRWSDRASTTRRNRRWRKLSAMGVQVRRSGPAWSRRQLHCWTLQAYLDATGESLAGFLRAGNAGSSTATDHVKVLDQGLFQLPKDPKTTEVICRTDTAGCSHDFLDAARTRGFIFCCGHALTTELAKVILEVPKSRWQPTISADGTEEREVGEVAEITDLVDLSSWPTRTRMLVRREEPHPGAQLTFTDVDGHRYQVFITEHPAEGIAFLEALYRGRGRCECPWPCKNPRVWPSRVLTGGQIKRPTPP